MALQDWQQVQSALKQYWGYEALRPPQDQVIRALLEKRDALVVLPTGFGKSLCFQLPALLQTGLTLVVSPLIALMEDQVQDLWRRRLPAACLHSELDPALRKRVLRALEGNRLRLLYLGPETLFSPPVWKRLQQVSLNGLIVDEAHTLVHWGGSFRPDYPRLGLVRPALGQPAFPIAAFTATADPETLSRLRHILKLRDPECIRADPLRANISLNVEVAWSPADRRRRLLRFLVENPGSGLVYVRTRRDGEELAEWLGRHHQKTAAYHGGLEAGSRRRLERAWLEGELRFLVCTNAFGMGVNKPDVRWVLHFHPPPNLMDYLQEVGRGGRDGGPCRALMLVSEPTGLLDPTDRQRQAYFYSQQERLLAQARRLLTTLPPQGSYADLPPGETRVALGLLQEMGCLHWPDPFHFQVLHRHWQPPPRQDPWRGMDDLIHSRSCRWQVILRHFGYPENQPGLPCGTCDRCRAAQRR
ncbi:putative ATP-dependent DNA helicase RecQ [Synechococcus sp. JA-3-3Ab]|nr:putative ATP-dependent DNA helicase RecQ [Synechococcus sp. JA-3-3Ab]